MSLSPPPTKALGFVVKPKTDWRDRWLVTPSDYENSKKNFLEPYQPAALYEPAEEEIAWLNRQQDRGLQVKPEEVFHDLQNWLNAELGNEIFCRYCGNALCLQFNTMHNGWSVDCSYCHMRGPVEPDKETAIGAFLTIIDLNKD